MTFADQTTTTGPFRRRRSGLSKHVKSLTWIVFSVSVSLTGLSVIEETRQSWEFDFADAPFGPSKAEFENFYTLHPASGVTHAPSIAIGADRIRILWFEGSAEAMPDVTIGYRDFSLPDLRETDGGTLISPQSATGAMTPGQPVVILGNTIQGRSGDLSDYYATVVSAGGWAAASVAHVKTNNDGEFLSARKLPLSPLINRSYLVRSTGVTYANGDVAVPVYHELLGAFGELLRIGPDGRIKSSARMGQGKIAIQPELVVTGPETAIAFLRPWDGSGRLLRTTTQDGSRRFTWKWKIPTAPSRRCACRTGAF